MWSLQRFAARTKQKKASGPPPLPPFPPPEKRRRPRRPWVRGEIDRVPDDATRAVQARVGGLANVARIDHEAQAAYGSAIEVACGRLDQLLASRGEAIGADDDASVVSQQDYVYDLLAWMAHELRRAEVTVNFRAYEWFANECTYQTYAQMFERHRMTGPGGRTIDVARSTQSGDPKRRAEVEEQKLIRPAMLTRGPLNLVANATNRFAQTGGMTKEGDDWAPNNIHFVGASRPRYAALNYTGDRNGACAAEGQMYGHSVLVWKDRVKLKATYCSGDSFNPDVDETKICTYDTMAAMLAWMTGDVFEDLYEKVRHRRTISPRVQKYIECHVYTPLRFREDLEYVRLDRSEADRSPRTGSGMSVVELNARKFCEANRVRLEWV